MSSASLLDPRNALLVVLALVALAYIVLVVRATQRGVSEGERAAPDALRVGTGFITNFFDTLGIGSYATTTAIFRRFSLVRDERIPGTLNFGHTLPTVAQAFIFTKIVPVDPKTLILLIVAAVLGAWVGAGVVAKWPRRRIQFGMAIALFVASALLIMTLANRNPQEGTLLELTGTKLALAFAGNVVLGALMTLGIGLYAPCLILVTLLGMNDKSGYPIMMGACAFLMPVAVVRFIRARAYHPPSMLSMAIPGMLAVPLAFKWFQNLDMKWVKVIVIFVVAYASITMLLTAYREKGTAAASRTASLEGASA